MADNESTGTGKAVATDKVTYSGDADQNVQLVRSVAVTGSEGSKTVIDHTYGNGVSGTGVQRVTIASDSTGQVAVSGLPVGLLDSFGHMIRGGINNQVDVQFYRGDGSVGDLVTETNANGGTATATGGMATFAATTTASSQAKGVSPSRRRL